MRNYRVGKSRPKLTSSSAIILASLLSMSATAGPDAAPPSSPDSRHHHPWKKRHKERYIAAVAVTGSNDVRGLPFFSWGAPYGAFSIPTVGAFNANGPEPLKIDQYTSDSAVLATRVDPNVLAVANATPEDVKPEWVNVPLKNIPVNVDFSFVVKRPLLGALESPLPIQPSLAEPAGTVTLGQWMSAKGFALISCQGDRATVNLRMRNLLPHRLYTVWGTLGLPKDATAVTFFPIPLGGTPNIVITDKYGSATFKRKIKFCPLDPDSTLRPLLTINVQYHGNQQSYGAVPEPGFLHGWWPGLVTFTQLQFPINVELLK